MRSLSQKSKDVAFIFSRCKNGGNDGLGKGRKTQGRFPPFPQPLEIARSGESHMPTAL
jgi:hypothetical protein